MLNLTQPIPKLDRFAKKNKGKTYHLLDIVDYLKIDRYFYIGIKLYLVEKFQAKVNILDADSPFHHSITL